MSKTIEQLQGFIGGFSAELNAMSKRQNEIQEEVEREANELSALLAEVEDLDELDEIEEQFREVLSEFASLTDQYWGGEDAWEYGDWEAGQPVSFWVPSTC